MTTSKKSVRKVPVKFHPQILEGVALYEPTKGIKPGASAAFDKQLSPALKKLLNNPPTLAGAATTKFDGRTIPIVLAVVRDKQGLTRAGMLVRFVQDGELKDHTRTNARGVALLRLPRAKNAGEVVEGTLEVLAPGIEPQTAAVRIPADRQHLIKEIVFEVLPPSDEAEEEDDHTRALSSALARTVPLQDNPLDRLPADFSTDLCADLNQLLGVTEDPILSLSGGESTDFRRRRIPLVKRLTVPRIGLNPGGAVLDRNPPRRYLVRVRQQWTFLGYTLGELANVDALDPGAILNETVESVSRLRERVARSLDSFTSQALDSTRSSLSEVSSIDALVRVATQTETFAAAGGFGFGLPGFGIGAAAAYGKVAVTSTARSSLNTSLLVNSSLQVARSVVNQTMRTAVTQLRDIENTVTRALGQISPLLSRVTNLLRWTLYENYLVCTHIEDVVEVQAVKLLDTLPAGTMFTDELIVEYRRIFEPRLLEPRLSPQFEVLRRAVALKRAATLPVTVVHVTADFAAVLAGADLKIGIGGDVRTVTLRPGATRINESFRLMTPIAMPFDGGSNPPPAMDVQLSLDLRPELGQISLPFGVKVVGNVTVSRLHFRLETSPGFSLERSVHLGTDFRVKTDNPDTGVNETHAERSEQVRVPPLSVFTQGDPLLVHINSNRHYYYGLLAQAALNEPALRDDSPLLKDVFPSDHDLWRLPIIGFEGDHALVIGDPDETIAEVKADLGMFRADLGAATLIQLAAPGAYAEALQGLLSLTDAVGKLHPQLLPSAGSLIAPVLPVTTLPGGSLGTSPVGGLPGTGTGTGGTGTGGLLGGGLPIP